MKLTLSICSLAALLALAGCEDKAPAPNKNAPVGTLKNGDDKVNEGLKEAKGATADAAATPPPAAPK